MNTLGIMETMKKTYLKFLTGEIVPKNILMVGPTGVGKTELSKAIAATYFGTGMIWLPSALCLENLSRYPMTPAAPAPPTTAPPTKKAHS